MSKELIIFTDSGDTIINEGTQEFDSKGIVTTAECIPGADKVLEALNAEGYRIALVADGEWDSFQNVYRQNGLGYCFEEWIVSEVVGEQKPARSMFDTAMTKMRLGETDKSRIVMIGNNLKKDIAGANRYGLTSIWLDWSPRYFHKVEAPDWEPDYTVHTPEELKKLMDRLEEEAEARRGGAAAGTVVPDDTLSRGMEAEDDAALYSDIRLKLDRILESFTKVLYETDDVFLQNMKTHNLAGDDISKYKFWEWTQGVGLVGLWKLFETGDGRTQCLTILREYYDRQLEIGFPALNVNTVTPYLAMSFLAEYTGEEKYLKPCIAAAQSIMADFPRTQEGGFQHKTSDTLNEQELWDDTLYMTVLFLANMGRMLKDESMLKEAEHQFLLHAKYLADPQTGLWYHGWTFNGRHNFAGAFWGRGNCWVTMAIPEYLSMNCCSKETAERLTEILNKQAESLVKLQDESGMWHTLVDDATSYPEASATCGFAYGLLKAVHEGYLPAQYRTAAVKALAPILECIDAEGVVHQVSYGTPMGRETKDFYKQIPLQPMPYGQALAILFLMEYTRS